MNKIYKLIWSKVKNMWVVASELAKSHTKSPNSGIGGVASLASLESKINMDLSKGFVAGVFPMVNRPVAKLSDFKITVAAIVKNEAENVPTWVQAARSCADEIVVVDTGSTDGTVERFKDYGIKCFHYDWNDDFASAKNYMISLCHGDWIVLLDGDEWFREGCDVRKAIAKHHNNPVTKAIIADWICLDKDRRNAVMFSGGAVRAFRNLPDVRYFRKVHENLTINFENFAFEPEFKMYHTGYSGSVNRSKHERNLRIMCTMFDFDNGKVEYPTDWRYIEDTYAGLGEFDKALWAADKMISYGVQEYSASAWVTKFNVLFAMKTPMEEMMKQFAYCFKTVPSVSGFRFLASVYYARNGRADLALDEYTEGVRMLMGPQDKVAMEHTFWRMYLPEASALMATVCLESGQLESALSALYVSEQYCGKTQWTDGVMVELRRRMAVLSKSPFDKVADKALPLLQFAKRGLVAGVLACVLSCGAVMPVEAVTGNYSAGGGSATDNYGISIGNSAKSQSVRGISLGLKADSQTDDTIAIGSCSVAGHRYDQTRAGLYAIAVGTYAFSGGQWNIAMGMESFAGYTSSKSIAIGGSIGNNSSNTSSIDGAVALGYCSVANVSNVVSVGHAKNDTYVVGSCGTTSTYSSDYFRRIINVANGTNAHDAATYGQVSGAIKGLSVSGKTITYTKIDGSTGTITTQDTNTTYSAATQSANGLMTAADKKKLDGIATGANAYSLPAATASALGGVKVGSNITVSSGTISLTKANVVAALGYTPPTSDTNTDTKVTNTLGTTTKYFLAGTTSATTNTGGLTFDTGIYATTTAGQLHVGSLDSGGAINGTSSTLTSASPSVYVKNTGLTRGTTPSSANNQWLIEALDSAGKATGGIYKIVNTGNVSEVRMYDYPNKDNTSGGHFIGIGHDANGNAVTYAPTPATSNNSTQIATTAYVKANLVNMTGASSSVAGVAGLVPAPAKGDQNKFLRADGTWVVPTDTNTHYTSHMYVGSGTAANAATTNGNTKIALIDDSTVRNILTIKGTGKTTVTSDANGVITINSTDANTTYSNMTAATASAAGAAGLVPAPAAGKQGQFLRGDGTWATPTNTTYAALTADELNTGTATTSRAITAKVLGDYVKGAVSDESSARTTAISSEQSARTSADTVLGSRIDTLNTKVDTKTSVLEKKTKFLHVNAEETNVDTIATGEDAVAVGKGTSVSGKDSVAMGTGSTVSGISSIAVGTGHVVTGNNSGTFGDPNIVYGDNSYVVGNNSTVAENVSNVFVLGNNVTVNNGPLPEGYADMTDEEKAEALEGKVGYGVVALGNNVNASLNNKSATNRHGEGTAVLQHSVAVGDSAVVGEENTVAIGYQAQATALNATAIGEASHATAEGTNAIGHSAQATGHFANALGYQSQATGEGAGAFGQGAQATANFTTAFGRLAKAQGASSTAIGNNANAVSQSAVAIGNSSVANGDTNTYAVAIGNGAVVGSATQGYGESTSIGGGASSQSTYATAVGARASVTASNAVALGAGSVADTANTVSVGKAAVTGDNPQAEVTRKIVHVTAGTSATDAATVGQVRTVSAGNGIELTETVNADGSKNEEIKVKAGANVTVNADGLNVVGNGTVASGDTGLVSGGTAYSELRPTANGNYIATANTTAQNLSALDSALKTADNTAVKNITSSGTTVTFIKGDGTTGTFTTQDNNTEYTAGNGLELTGTEFTAKAGTNVTVDNNGINVAGNGTVADGNTGLVSGGTLFTEGRVSADGTYVRVSNTVAGNLTALDTAVKANADDITQINTDLAGKANTSLNNITNDGKSVIKTNAKEAINVVGSGKATVDKTDVNGVDTYTVGVTVDGTVAEGNTGIVDGGTVYSALQAQKTTTDTALTGKANVALDNVTEAGHNVIKSDAKAAVNAVAGTHTTISKTDVDGVDTYAVNVITDGVVVDGNTGIVTGGTVYTALNTEKTARETADTTLQTNIGNEATARAAGDTAIENKIGSLSADGNYILKDNTVSQNLSVLDTQAKANADAIAVNTTDITNLKDLSNITDAGVNVIKSNAKGAVNITGSGKATVTKTDVSGVDTYNVEVLANGVVDENNDNLVSGGTVYSAIQSAIASSEGGISTALTGKANVAMDNLTDAGKGEVRTLAKEAVKVIDGTHTTVTKGADGNADTYAVNVATDGTVTNGDTGIVTGGIVYNAVHAEEESRKAADNALSDRIGTIDSDKNYVLKDNSVSDNLMVLDTQVKRNADDIAGLKDLSNLTDDGETVIKNLSKGSVNVVGDGKASVVKTDVNGVDTYTVTVNADGAVADGNTNFVSGGTVYNVVHAEQVSRENADNALSERIGSVTADGNYISKSDTKSVSENLSALDTAIKTVADNASASVVANKTRFFGVNSTNEYDMNYDGGGAVGTNAIAVGPGAWADSNDSIAIGNMSATMFGEKAVAMGYGATALEENAVAVGPFAQAPNKFGTAVGSNAAAAGWSSTAIGKNALASGKNSIAVGSDSTATGEDEFSVGRPAVEANAEFGIAAQPEVKRRITHVATGVNDTDAVNVKQLDDALYDKADWNAANIGRNLVLADDEYPDGVTDEQKSEYLANMRQYNLQSWGQALGAGTVTGGDSRLITGDTLHVEVRPSENGTYVKTNNTTGQNLLALDQLLSTVLEGNASQNTAISDLQNEMETKANVGLDNITDAGKTVVRDLAKESVKVVNGTNTTVTEGTDGNAKTYAVNAVTDGAVADGNTGIVTGGTVYSAIQDTIVEKANVALDNVTVAGHTVIKTDAKSAVNVTGNSDVTVTKTDVDGVDTYNVAVVKTGTVTDGNEGIVTGDTVYDALRAETRPAADGNYIAADLTAGANLTALDTQVKTNADAIAAHTTDITNLKDLSNITDAGQTVVQNLAKGSVNVVGANKASVTKTNVDGVDTYTVDVKADGEILADNKGLVDGGTVFDAVVAATGNIIDYTNDGLDGKANVELDNINPAGHTVIKSDAKSAINVVGGTNAEVVKTDVDGVDTYTVNVSGNGQVAENNTGLVNGGTVYTELRPTDGNYVRKDATTAANLLALDTKIGTVANGDFVRSANTVGQNLNALDEALYDKANWDASNIGRNLPIAESDYPDGLTDEQKAEYVSNQRNYNLRSWGQALGAGTVTGGDARLITGDTLHVEVRPANSGTYVKVDKTTGENLLALDEQLFSVVNGASAQNTTINNLENEMANKANIALDNINADGQNVIRNIAKSAVVVADGPNTTVASSTDMDGNITYRVTANATGSVTNGNTGLVDGGAVYTAIENAKAAMGGEIGGLDADGNYIRKANTVAQNLVALDTQVKTNADGLVAEQTARENADTVLGNRIGTLTADGNYIAKDSSVSENLSRLDTVVKTTGDTADANAAAISDLKDLSNITGAGETVIKDLAKGSVKVINGTNTTVTEGMDGDVKTFAVNVASNGAVADGDTGLVSGGTVKSALDALSGSVDAGLAGKVNVSLDNVTDAGHAVIKSDAKSAMNVVGGQYATIAKTDVNGVDTYTVNVATDGSVANGNGKLVTGGTVYQALQTVQNSVDTALGGKVNTSLDNLDTDGVGRVQDIARSAVAVANGTNTSAISEIDANGNVIYKVNVAANGSIASGNAGIMSGGTMYDELRPVDGNYVARSSTTAANLTALDAAVKEALTKAEMAQAVTGGNAVIYDTDDKSSVSLGGANGTVIHNVADGAVTADSRDAVTGGQLYTVKSAVDANTTAIAGLDTRVQDNTTAIDTLRTTVTNGLDGKTDTDLGNLSDTGKGMVRDLAKESVRVADGVNTTVRTTVDGDASVYHVDVAANGRVESGNTGIVTGDAVYEAIRDIEINASDTHYVSINPSEKDDETFANHGASGTDAVAIGAKSYASGDESVAIGHNNDVSGNEMYVIGSDVNATGNNSVVLGKGSDGSLDNVVSVGSDGNERRIVHVADGKLSADSKDAVNGKQLYEVREKLQNAEGIDVDKWSDALGAGSVAPDDERLVKGSTVYSAIQSTGISLSPDGSTMNVGAANNATVVDFTNSEGNGRVLQGIVTDPGNPNSAANVGYVNAIGQNIVNGVNSGLNRLDTKINKVGAGAAALASLAPMPFDDDQKWSISAAIGTYHGTQAGAVGVFYKPQDNVMLNIRGAIGNGENMGGAGLSIGLNKGAAKGLSKASMAKAMNAQANEIVAQKQLIENQQAQLDAQKAEIEELKQMVRSVVASKQIDK